MSFNFGYSILPLPVNTGEDMGFIDNPNGTANYGTMNPGYTGSLNMRRGGYAWVNPILNCFGELQRKFNDIAQEMRVLNRTIDLLRQGALEDTRGDRAGYPPWPAETTRSYAAMASIFGDDVMQTLNRSPEHIRQGEIEETRVGGLGYPDDEAQRMQTLGRSLDILGMGAIEDMRVDGSGYPSWPSNTTRSCTTTASILGDDVNRPGAPIVDTSYAGNTLARLAEANGPSGGYASQSMAPAGVDKPTGMHDVMIFYRNGTKRYRCPCGSETERKGDMGRHLKSGNHFPPQFACACGRRFTRQDARKSHEKKCRTILEAQNALST